MRPRRPVLLVALVVPALIVGLAAVQLAGAPPAPASRASLRAPTISPNDHHDASPPIRDLPPSAGGSQRDEQDEGLLPHPATVPGAVDTVVQSTLPAPLIPATATSFDGVGNGFSGPQGTFAVNSAPPDTNGDVGPNHYVQIVNTDFAVFGKAGAVLLGPIPINTLWSGFGGLCQSDNDGDPTVKYDRIADRWIISQFAVTGANGGTTPYLQCVAVSQTGDPTGAYFRYSFPYSSFPDYPKLGVWPDAYYETFNMFAGGTTFSGGQVCAYDRTKMLTGATATQQCFNVGTTFGGLLPSDLDGSRLPPAGSPNYAVALGATNTQLASWSFHVDWTTPANTTLSGPTALATSAYTLPCGGTGGTCVPQPGTSQQLDTLGDRLMYRLAYRNFGDHEALVVDHSVTAGTGIGVRWYELRVGGGALSIFQQGTYAPDSTDRWMGSIAQDQAGDMGLGLSTSSGSLHPAIAYTGRLAGDAAGQMTQGEATIVAGAGSQTSSLTRWGDYSAMAVDPSDDCTFWYTNEYIPANGSFNWKTRIASFKFPSCGSTLTNDFSVSANPASLSLAQGTAGTSTISTAVTSGSAGTVSLAISGAPAGATATLSPTSVTAGGSSTLSVNAGTAAAGTYTLSVTGTEGTATHSASVSLTVTAPATNDFSIAASPATLTVAQGTSGTSTVGTAVTAGSAGTVSLSATGAPAGVTATLSPTSVTAGGSSTLSLTVTTSASPGTTLITVTGVEGTATHSASVSLTVTTAAGLPGAPTLTSSRSGRRGVQLNWTVPPSNGSALSAYRIYRSLQPGTEQFLTQRGSTSTSYRDTNTSSGTRYYYKITAVNGVGQGPLSNEASAIAR